MSDVVKDAVGRVEKYLDQFEVVALDTGGFIASSGSSDNALASQDIRTILQALADAKAENEGLQYAIAKLTGGSK